MYGGGWLQGRLQEEEVEEEQQEEQQEEERAEEGRAAVSEAAWGGSRECHALEGHHWNRTSSLLRLRLEPRLERGAPRLPRLLRQSLLYI